MAEPRGVSACRRVGGTAARRSRARNLSFGVSPRDTDLVGHDQPFFADQGNSAIAQRGLGIVVANQLVSVEQTADQGPKDLQSEIIPLMPMPSKRYFRQQLDRIVVSEKAQSLTRSEHQRIIASQTLDPSSQTKRLGWIGHDCCLDRIILPIARPLNE